MNADQLQRQAAAAGLDLPHVGPWHGRDATRELLEGLDQALGALDTVLRGVEAERYRGQVLHVRAVLARVRLAHRSEEGAHGKG